MSSVPARVIGAGLTVSLCVAAVALASARDAEPPAERSTASWGALAPSPLERTEVGAARVGDRIYVVGGYISSGGTTGQMARYDISSNRWREVATLPIAVNHPGVTAHRGRVYVLGGNLAGGAAKSKRLYRYMPARDRWKRLPDASIRRGALALVGRGGELYAIGGYSNSNDRLRAVEVYDISRHEWGRGRPMPTGRNHVGAAALGGWIYVTGGRPGPVHGGLDTVERYDAARDRWQRVAPLITARSGHAAVSTTNRIVAFGGEELDGGTTISAVEAYEPERDRWTELPAMITPRHGLGGVARAGRVFAFEGGPRPGLAYSRSLEFLDLP
jgi:N-acetylneuraminic acid mutarotase